MSSGTPRKDAFAMLANRAGTMPTTKAEAQSWFETHIRKGMEELGHKINWVDGDKFSFTNWQGTFTIDFVFNAGGPDPALAWTVID
jgi:alpha-glucosidase (family GH31 glycosyl hydrolase)